MGSYAGGIATSLAHPGGSRGGFPAGPERYEVALVFRDQADETLEHLVCLVDRHAAFHEPVTIQGDAPLYPRAEPALYAAPLVIQEF